MTAQQLTTMLGQLTEPQSAIESLCGSVRAIMRDASPAPTMDDPLLGSGPDCSEHAERLHQVQYHCYNHVPSGLRQVNTIQLMAVAVYCDLQ